MYRHFTSKKLKHIFVGPQCNYNSFKHFISFHVSTWGFGCWEEVIERRKLKQNKQLTPQRIKIGSRWVHEFCW